MELSIRLPRFRSSSTASWHSNLDPGVALIRSRHSVPHMQHLCKVSAVDLKAVLTQTARESAFSTPAYACCVCQSSDLIHDVPCCQAAAMGAKSNDTLRLTRGQMCIKPDWSHTVFLTRTMCKKHLRTLGYRKHRLGSFATCRSTFVR